MNKNKVIYKLSLNIFIKYLEENNKLAQNYKNRLNDFMTKMIK